MNSSKGSRHGAGRIIVIGGVSGCGKSTVGKALAVRLGWPFIEGDTFHSEANIEKMRRGEALDDDDRGPWLESLHNEIMQHLDRGCSAVLACSALKASYREILRGTEVNVSFVFLSCSRESLYRRLPDRVLELIFFAPRQLLSYKGVTNAENAGAFFCPALP